REYAGQTPYGEGRGGHLPGATNVWFKSFLKSDGYLKSREEITRLLLEHGITDKNEIIVYCSGGFRSAWVMSVLNDYGYQVKNYAGSMWQWSDRNFLRFPLVVATHRP
ncbi:rhodanese-like domain-containing protein, partial [Zwartia sp.]|uniref:sulfurtransferase n=1 Tax=Zwartia sp. TaxID=2978004 RepID=UPI002717F10A